MTNFHRPAFDTGPLSWVIGEIREALGHSADALDGAAADAGARSTQLQLARTHLHQAHGALQMVDVAGASAMTEAAEQAIDHLRASDAAVTPQNAAAMRESYGALVEYLDELLAGEQPQPVRLFPYYRALLELQGADRIHPSDLFTGALASAPVNRSDGWIRSAPCNSSSAR